MIRKELLTLLEHDNAKYPLDEVVNKDKRKGAKRVANGPAVPVIKDFQEDEMKDADQLIKDEAQYLRVAMGHESDSLDDFVEAHTTCINDLMYFATRNAYGLSSVAGNMEKLAALQGEFDDVRSKLDGKEKMVRLEKKVTVLTQGYEMRAKKSLWPQIEATFKQMDIAATESECFQALQKQAISSITQDKNLWTEVQKQKELEKTLQKRYGDLIAEIERLQNVMNQLRAQAQHQEEIEANNRALELTEATADQINVQGTSSSKNDMDVDSCKEETTHNTDIKLPDAPAAEDESANVAEGKNTGSDIDNKETTLDVSAAVEISSIEGNGEEDRNVENPDEAVEAVNKPDNSLRESTPLDDGNNTQVADGKRGGKLG
ncbi:Pre-mRNA splicing factor component Cdc5p/Cef1 [Sesbania bispinosa]|nr:Pre-mRNA splicing factor component Cdc5p/Cef1 [Sesbania bispinosa]